MAVGVSNILVQLRFQMVVLEVVALFLVVETLLGGSALLNAGANKTQSFVLPRINTSRYCNVTTPDPTLRLHASTQRYTSNSSRVDLCNS